MRWPSCPPTGGDSRPGRSRSSFTQWTVRAIERLLPIPPIVLASSMAEGLAQRSLRLRVLFFGMTGAFSIPPLEALLAAGVHVCGVVVPAAPGGPAWAQALAPEPPRSGLPLLTPYVQRNVV